LISRVFTNHDLWPRNLTGLILGMISSLPLLLTWQFFNLWMTDRGISSVMIAAFSWMGLPHMIKTLFIPWLTLAPNIPWLHENRWVSWMILSSFLIAITLPIFCAIAILNNFWMTVSVGVFLNILGIIFVKAFGFYQLTQVNPKIRMELIWGQDIGQHIGHSLGQAAGLLVAHVYCWEALYLICSLIFLLMSITLMNLSSSAYEAKHVQAVSTLRSWKEIGHTAWQHHLFLIICFFMSAGDYLIGLFFQIYLRDLGLSYLEIVKYSKIWGLLCYIIGAMGARYYLTPSYLTRLPELCALACLLHGAALSCFIDKSFIANHIWIAFFLKNVSLGYKGILTHALIVNYITTAQSHLTGQLYFLSSIRRSVSAAILINFSMQYLQDHSLTQIIMIGSLSSIPAAFLLVRLQWESKSWGSSKSSENASSSISS